jgi:hypothetical protein
MILDELVVDFIIPKIAPRTIAPINKIINMHNGMANLFLRYQWRLIKVMKIFMNNSVKKNLLNPRIKTCT